MNTLNIIICAVVLLALISAVVWFVRSRSRGRTRKSV
jgi:uncharacterized membrane protein affecting hemolysin expression